MGQWEGVGFEGMTRGVTLSALLVATVCGALAPVSADAQDVAQADLAYERTADASACPDADEFREMVAERLGRDPFVSGSPRVVHVVFQREGRDYVGTVGVSPAGGARAAERALRARSCESVATSLATVIAVGLEAPPVGPETTAAPEATAVPEPDATPADSMSVEPDLRLESEHAPVAVATASTSVEVVVLPPATSEAAPLRRRRALIAVAVVAIAGAVLAVGITRGAGPNYADYTATDISVAALRFGR